MMAAAMPGRAGAARLWVATLGVVALGVVAALAPASAATPPLPALSPPLPQDFAYGSPVVVPETSVAYRLSLPLAVYQHTVRADLGDLRVFNAAGEVATYALQGPVSVAMPAAAPAAPAATSASGVDLPLFELPNGARPVIDGIRLSVSTNGSAVQLQTPAPRESGGVPGEQLLLDGRGLATPVGALQLHWAQSDLGYSGHLRIDVSEDLGIWRTLVGAAPIVNLRANGQSLVQNRIEFPSTQAKFWRLTWLGAAPPLHVDAVTAEFAETVAPAAHETLDVSGTADPANPQVIVFDLGAPLPVQRLGLLLPEANTLDNVELSTRSTPNGQWQPVVRGTFSRLSGADGDRQTPPLAISIERSRYWRARLLSVDARSAQLPRLQVEWVPDELVFLARGQGPYLLAYGSGTILGAPVDLGQLPEGLTIAAATLGEARVIGGVARLEPAAAPLPRRQFWLWGVLLLAVGVLAWMAYRLVTTRAS